MRIIFTSALVLLMTTTTIVNAQIQNLGGTGGTVLRETKYAQIDGSPYLFEKYKKAYAYNSAGEKVDVFAKYDSYKEEVEIHNGGSPLILDASEYSKIEFNFYDELDDKSVKMIFQNGFDIAGYGEKDYFQVLTSGKVKVLKKISTDKIDEDEASYGGTNNISSRFITKERYFLIRDDQETAVFKRISKSSVLKAFDEKRLVDFTKKKKLKLKTEKDLLVLVDYYESLD